MPVEFSFASSRLPASHFIIGNSHCRSQPHPHLPTSAEPTSEPLAANMIPHKLLFTFYTASLDDLVEAGFPQKSLVNLNLQKGRLPLHLTLIAHYQ